MSSSLEKITPVRASQPIAVSLVWLFMLISGFFALIGLAGAVYLFVTVWGTAWGNESKVALIPIGWVVAYVVYCYYSIMGIRRRTAIGRWLGVLWICSIMVEVVVGPPAFPSGGADSAVEVVVVVLLCLLWIYRFGFATPAREFWRKSNEQARTV